MLKLNLKAIIKGVKNRIDSLTATVINEGERDEKHALDVKLYMEDGEGNPVQVVGDSNGNLRIAPNVNVEANLQSIKTNTDKIPTSPAKEKICKASYTEDNISGGAIDLTSIEGEITRIELNNDGVTNITITIGSISKTIRSGESYNQNFAPFTSIGITGSNPVFRLDVLG